MDQGFVQMCQLRAEKLQEEGEKNQAGFLRNVAQQVGAFLASQGAGGNSPQALEDFWIELIKAERESGGDADAVHQVMRQNLSLLTPALGEIIGLWV